MIRLVALIIIIIGFALRVYNLAEESLWYDELLQLDISQQAFKEIFPPLHIHAALPLDYILIHFWTQLGRHDFWVRLPAAILGTLALPLVYQLGRRLQHKLAGLIVMGLLALSPFHLQYSQEVRPYALLIVGVLLAGCGFWGLWQRGRWIDFWLLLSGVLIFSLSHFFALAVYMPWFLCIVIVLMVGLGRKQAKALKAKALKAMALKAMGGLFVAGTVGLVILLGLGWGRTFFNISYVASDSLAELTSVSTQSTQSPANDESETEVKRLYGPTVNWHFVRNIVMAPLAGGKQNTILLLFNGLVGLGVIDLLLRRQHNQVLFLGLWFLVPIITVIAFLIHRDEFFATRYIISVLPAYLMLVTIGMVAIPRWLKFSSIGWLALLLICAVLIQNLRAPLQQYYAGGDKEDWRLVTRFVTQNAKLEDAVMAVNAESTLNWYFPSATAESDYFDDLENIKARVSEAQRSWVIVSIFSVYLGPKDALIKAWLGEQGAIRLEIDPLIVVYYVGPTASPDELLDEIQTFALPVNHALYASLARENRHRLEVAQQYYHLAIQHAPDEQTRLRYDADLQGLLR